MLELADLFIDDIQDQGTGECKSIIWVLNHGKTNYFGKNQFAATLRHKDVFQCPQSKLVFINYNHRLVPLEIMHEAMVALRMSTKNSDT